LDIKLNKIIQEQISTNLTINRILAKILLMEANSKNKDQNNDTSICINSQFLSYFPLKNAEGLFLLENRIKNEFEFVPKLVILHYYLCSLNLFFKQELHLFLGIFY